MDNAAVLPRVTGVTVPDHRGTSPRNAVRPHLRVRFLGHFEVFYDGETLRLGHKAKASAILKYLLAHRDHPVSRDYLMGWLWPESNLKRARWSLNSTVYVLRKQLSNGYGSPVLFEHGYYRLCPTFQVSADTDEFDARYEQGYLLEKVQRMPEAAAEYERAVELYRGDYLVEELYADWTMIERERLVNAYVDMLDRLADYYMESAQIRESIRSCYQLLEKDPCHEGSYRLLMRGYARLGLRTRALRQYQVCEQILRNKYDVVPSPETLDLRRSLLNGNVE